MRSGREMFGRTLDLLEATWRAGRSRYVPTILTFHSIGSNDVTMPNGDLSPALGTERFIAFLDWIEERGEVQPLESVAARVVTGKTTTAPTVAITFDDGCLDNYEVAFPLLRERGLTATFFIPLCVVGSGGVDDGMLKEMAASGMEIGSHTVTHPVLPKVDAEQLARELRASKETLQKMTGAAVTAIAYPYGRFDDRVRDAAAIAGYRIGVATGSGRIDEPLALPRTELPRTAAPNEFKLHAYGARTWRSRVRGRARSHHPAQEGIS